MASPTLGSFGALGLAVLILATSLIPAAHAGSISDFANDLATDLGPLVQLFGEPVTRQYLSEATTFIDYFIFAMTPIGILTAMVSVIRVCGDASLRAFVGRAQEGEGQVEAELCTSTSRDVCELFNKGGITRVLGRPNILEIVHVARSPSEDADESMGLFLFRSHLRKHLSRPGGDWEKCEPNAFRLMAGLRQRRRMQGPDGEDPNAPSKTPFVPNPNLSLNLGIVKFPRGLFIFVAAVGLTLQAGLLIMAGVTSWQLGWSTEDDGLSPSSISERALTTITDNPSPLIFICGSFFMCVGMFFCAALIGHSTQEYTYGRRPSTRGPRPRTRLFWLQPGGQLIGDQTFDAFAVVEEDDKQLKDYTFSRKDLDSRSEVYTWFVVAITLGGYVTQFIGLRGMNAYVSVSQLAATLLMSFLRGCLRMRRLTTADNKLAKVPDKVVGHELDWMAFEIASHSRDDLARDPALTVSRDWFWYPSSRPDTDSGPTASTTCASPWPDRLFRYRSRLAVLTGHHDPRGPKEGTDDFQQWAVDQVKVREMAVCLQKAIEGVADALIGDHIKADTIPISMPVTLSGDLSDTCFSGEVKLNLQRNMNPTVSDNTLWTVKSPELEAILGLWLWSLKKGQRVEARDRYGNMISVAEDLPNYRIIGLKDDFYWEELEMWLGSHCGLSSLILTLDARQKEALHSMTLWEAKRIGNDFWYTPYEGTVVDPKGRERRLFGWTALDGRVRPSTEAEPMPDKIQVQCIRTVQPLLAECAHELFSSFVKQLLDSTKPGFGDTVFSGSNGRLKWENVKVSSMLARFEESGLGASIDALMHLIPTLRRELRPPDGEMMIAPLLDLSIQYQKRDDWGGAERLLRWACISYSPLGGRGDPTTSHLRSKRRENLCSVLIVTGELYRSAFRQNERDKRDFGYRGVQWMLTKFRTGSQPLERHEARIGDDVDDILARYEEVACRVAIDRGETPPTKRTFRQFDSLGSFLDWQRDFDVQLLCDAYESLEAGCPGLFREWRKDQSDERPVCTPADDSPEPGTDRYGREQQEKIAALETPLPAQTPTGEPSLHKPLAVHGSDTEDDDAGVRSRANAEASEHDRTRMLYIPCSMTSQTPDPAQFFSVCRAARWGWIEVVAGLLRNKGDVNEADKWGRTPLHYAAEQGHLAVAQLLLTKGANPDVSDELNGTPLFLAAYAQRDDMVSLLLRYSAVSTVSKAGGPRNMTPLIAAARTGNAKIVLRLASSGALTSVNSTDSLGRSSVWYAAALGRLDIVEILLRDVITRTDIRDCEGLTPVTLAAWSRNEDLFSAVLLRSWSSTGPNSMLRDSPRFERTALSIAIEADFRGVFDALMADEQLDFQARQISWSTFSQDTKEHFSFCDGSSQWCMCLQQKEEGVTAVTGLGMAIEYCRGHMLHKLLKDRRFTGLDHLAENLIATAAFHGRTSILKELLAHPIEDPNRDAPLAKAVMQGHADAMNTLLRDDRFDITAHNLLEVAVTSGRKAAVVALLGDSRFVINEGVLAVAFGARRFDLATILFERVQDRDVRFSTLDNGSGLHAAARYGSLELAESLLKLGASPNILDDKARTPLSIALETGSMSVATVLLNDQRTDLGIDGIGGCSWTEYSTEEQHLGGTILHFAMTLGTERCIESVKLLLSSPRLDSNLVDQMGRSPLEFLLENQAPDGVRYDLIGLLISDPLQRLRITEVSVQGRTALHLAAESGIGIQYLLDQSSINPNVKDAMGRTPLHAAAARGTYVAIVALLRDLRTDPALRDPEGRTAYDILDLNAHSQAASAFLIDGRSDPWRSQNGTTSLHIIARHGVPEMADFLATLLESERINKNQWDAGGQTALSIAVDEGKSWMVDMLLSHDSVDPNAKDRDEETPLHRLLGPSRPLEAYLAVLRSFFANPKLDPNKTNAKRETALHKHVAYLASLGRATEAIIHAFMVDSRSDLNAQTTTGQTALHLVAYHTSRLTPVADKHQRQRAARIIRAFALDQRLNPNLLDNSGQTVLHIVSASPNLTWALNPIIRAFLDLPQFDPNTPDSDGRTLLHLLAEMEPNQNRENQALAAIRHLLRDPRIDVTRLDRRKRTALQYAINAGFNSAARVLASDDRIEVNAQDEMGNSALHQAVESGNKVVLEMLLKNRRVNRKLMNGAGQSASTMAREGGGGRDFDRLIRLFRTVKVESAAHEMGGNSVVEEVSVEGPEIGELSWGSSDLD